MRALTGEIGCVERVEIGGRGNRAAKGRHLAARRAVLPQAATPAFRFTVVEAVRTGLLSGTRGAGAGSSALGRGLAYFHNLRHGPF